MTIPTGYERILGGSVQVGDFIWCLKRKTWLEVTPDVLNNLGFLDARSVEDLHVVVRKKA